MAWQAKNTEGKLKAFEREKKRERINKLKRQGFTPEKSTNKGSEEK